jgi:hypothetical protein
VVRGRSLSVDVTPVEVLEDLRFAWMSYQQAKNGPLTLFADVIYADEQSGGSFFASRTFSPQVGGTLGATLSATYRYWTVEAGGTYEIASWNSHGARYATPDTEIEVLAGGRYWHQQIDVGVALAGTANFDGLIISGDRAIARSGTHEWVDPFIGARIRFQPARDTTSHAATGTPARFDLARAVALGDERTPGARLCSRRLDHEVTVGPDQAAGGVRAPGIASVQHERLHAAVGDADAEPWHERVLDDVTLADGGWLERADCAVGKTHLHGALHRCAGM